LPTLDLLGPSNITGLTVGLGGLLSGGGSLFDSVGLSLSTELGDLDLSGVAVGPIASMVELDQSIAEALGWSGVGDPLSGLADLGSSTADAAAWLPTSVRF
jgi:hypothetical protein